MNVLLSLTTTILLGFAVGFVARSGLSIGGELLPLCGLLAFVAAIVLLFEITWVAPPERTKARVEALRPQEVGRKTIPHRTAG